MEREILFRGKLEYNGKWIYGDLVQYEDGDVAIFGDKLSSFGCECTEMSKRDRVIPDTVGQYTGLTDKNGNKIFEGDILSFRVLDCTIRHFVVEWASEDRILIPSSKFAPNCNPVRISGWCFNRNGHRIYPTVIDGIPDNEEMTIVGNIFDNPKLIK